MPTFGFLKGKFFGNAASTAAGFAGGVAVAPALEPVVREVVNEAWSQYQTMPLDPSDWAEIVAEDVKKLGPGETEAKKSGIKPSDFDALVNATLNAPGVGELLRMWRRGAIDDAKFVHGLRKARFETTWDTGVEALKDEYLDDATIANAIQRGVMHAPFNLPYNPEPGAGKINSFPQSGLDTTKEAAANGTNTERLFVQTALAGNPPGPQALYRAQFRGAIEPNDTLRGLNEGRARAEWAPAFEADAREIPTAHDFVENHLRGYSQASDMTTGAARHGMSAEDVNVLFENAGRPLVVHQITTGLARGGTFNPEPNELKDPYEASVHESNIKPSYYDLAIANRYSYPSLFQLNSLVKANAITADVARDWAYKDGYAPEVLDALHTFWQGEQASGTGGTGVKPKQYTYSQIHSAWSHNVFTDAQALTELADIGYPAAKAQTLLDTWKVQSTSSTR